MDILTSNNQTKIPIGMTLIKAKGETILNALGLHDDELSIVIVDDDGIRKLNREYRKKDVPTNVLSFPMQEGEFSGMTNMLGDVVISAETAQKEAEASGISFNERLSQLLVHGILHLTGYDHDLSDAQHQAMEKKSIELLRLIEDNTTLDFF